MIPKQCGVFYFENWPYLQCCSTRLRSAAEMRRGCSWWKHEHWLERGRQSQWNLGVGGYILLCGRLGGSHVYQRAWNVYNCVNVFSHKKKRRNAVMIKFVLWYQLWHRRGDIFMFFCSLYSAGHLNASRSKQKDQRSSWRSIQNALNIKGTQLQTGAPDCTRVTSAWSVTSHWAAVLHSADRGEYLSSTNRQRGEESAADGGICAGVRVLSDLWLMGLIPALHCEAPGSLF